MKGFFFSLCILTLCAILCAPALGARLPEDGDYVSMSVPSTEGRLICYEGFVTGISDGLICMNCMWQGVISGDETIQVEGEYPLDLCIGSGQIALLTWKEPPEGYKEVP